MGESRIETMPFLYLSLNTISLLAWMVCDFIFLCLVPLSQWSSRSFLQLGYFGILDLKEELHWYVMNSQSWMSKFDEHWQIVNIKENKIPTFFEFRGRFCTKMISVALFLESVLSIQCLKWCEFKSQRKSIFNIHVTKVCKKWPWPTCFTVLQ